MDLDQAALAYVDLTEGKYGGKKTEGRVVEYPVTYTASSVVRKLEDRSEHREHGIPYSPDVEVHHISHYQKHGGSDFYHVAHKDTPEEGKLYGSGFDATRHALTGNGRTGLGYEITPDSHMHQHIMGAMNAFRTT
jgi:hypothetical protein